MKRVLFIYLFIVSISGYSQRRYAADRYFKEFAYKKAAELYKILYDKGDDSQLVISRLGDSHYYNTESLEAERWYKLLMERYENEVHPEYMFRYAQVLKSNGKVKESDLWLEKLKQTKQEDSRALALKDNRDYFAEYSNKKKTFVNVNNLSINTKYSDFGGFIYDSKLYYASTKPEGTKYDKKIYRWNNQPFLNIYTAEEQFNETNGNLILDNIMKFSDINTRYHESNAVLTNDGKNVYFTRDNYDGKQLGGNKNQIVHLKLYKAILKDNGRWEDIQELPFNNELYSCGHPALSSDGRTLYFVSDMPGGFGSTDIYQVFINVDGSYGNPVNLGNRINTEGREMFPYVDKENTMYFSSDGHLGLGALDIFESKVKERNFTKPVNLGTPVNSPLDDFSFVISDDKSHGYFSSNRAGGKGDDDIYSFMIYRCKGDIAGIITDSTTGIPISNVVVRLVDANGVSVNQQITGTDGCYVFKDIQCESNFTIAASENDYKNVQKKIITGDIEEKTITIDLFLESLTVETPKKEPQIVINPVYFDFDLYNIRKDAEYELKHIVSVMKNHPGIVLGIESHTDSRGAKTYNRTLSANRAKSTKDYLISHGIAPNRITRAIGYGEDYLLNDCDDANQKRCTEEQHQKNRRSYFYIIDNAKNNIQVNQEERASLERDLNYHIISSKKETLFNISQRYGLTLEKLKKLNNLKSNIIQLGQKLKVSE